MNALLLAIALAASTPSAPVAPAPKPASAAKAPKKWSCGAPRQLENDAVQTVRVCEWK